MCARAGRDSVIPSWTDRTTREINRVALFVGNLAALVEEIVEEECFDSQTGFCGGFLDKGEHSLQRSQRLSGPIDRNLAEEAILDGIVFGSTSWIMANHNGDTQFIGQALEFVFP